MPIHVSEPIIVPAAGEPSKSIREFVGRVSDGTDELSIAWMSSPAGWTEPGQVPEFDEYTIVMSGTLQVEYLHGAFQVVSGQAIIARAGEWIRYSTPNGAEYIAICVPAFSPETVNRDEV